MQQKKTCGVEREWERQSLCSKQRERARKNQKRKLLGPTITTNHHTDYKALNISPTVLLFWLHNNNALFWCSMHLLLYIILLITISLVFYNLLLLTCQKTMKSLLIMVALWVISVVWEFGVKWARKILSNGRGILLGEIKMFFWSDQDEWFMMMNSKIWKI